MPSSLGWIARREALPMPCASTTSAAPEASTTRTRKRMFANETSMRNKLNRSTAALNWLAGAMRIQLRESREESREDEKQYPDKHLGEGLKTNFDKEQDTFEEELSSLRQAVRKSTEKLEELRAQMFDFQEKLVTIVDGSAEMIAKKLDTLDKAKADKHYMLDFQRAFQQQLLTLSNRVDFPAEGPHEISDFGEDSQSYADSDGYPRGPGEINDFEEDSQSYANSDADSEPYRHHQPNHMRSS
eukprot:TRINITY_DN6658_c0_g1_i1.p1 TRINITY_DN6658_c0_g1~~TRINITY_DN6658_c0_g1_i1.p1  ORF type:complete len:281 (-),score=56.22 TRINITY_DN6658_c0_g1_i1:263-991(-)